MTVTEYLISLGYSQEDANTLAADEKTSKPIATALAKMQEGQSALQQAEQTRAEAQRQKQELETWWKEQAQPALLAADGGSAAAKAEAAQYREYIKSLKDQGYPVPDKWLDSNSTPVTPVTPQNNTPSFDPDKYRHNIATETAESMARLYDLGEEYRELFGSRMPETSTLLAEARQQNKPLVEFVRTKFNFEGKRQEIAEKKIQDRIEAARKEEEAKYQAKLAERSNPNLAPAISSRAAQVAESFKDQKDSWKNKANRAEAKAERLVKFRPLADKIA